MLWNLRPNAIAKHAKWENTFSPLECTYIIQVPSNNSVYCKLYLYRYTHMIGAKKF
jgi:hypothetical protein